MITRFERALAQIARSENSGEAERMALESHAQKVRRLEEMIRAKEATGDRVVIGIAAALVLSAVALPVYAAFYSDGYAYLPVVGNSLSNATSMVAERLQRITPDPVPAADAGLIEVLPAAPREALGSRPSKPEATFARYVVHRASESAALIEGPNGLWWVKPGMKIPGAGRILSIEHSDAGWAVVTSETTITELRGETLLR